MTIDWTFFPVREFGAHQDQWQEISLAGTASPLLSSRFVAPFIEYFADGDELIAICSKDRIPVAMTILKKIGHGKWETFQPSQAPLGMLVKRASIGLEDLLRSLLSSLPGIPLVVGISRQDPDLSPRPAESGYVSTLDFIHTARVLINRSFDEYWKARDGKLRQETNRRLKRMHESGIEPRLELVTDSAAVAVGIEDFGKLESAGWKGREGTAVHADNKQGNFYKSLLASFCGIGKGRIYRYWFGASVAAMQLCIEGERVLVFLKTTYDESFKNHGPGILMQYAIMKQLFAEGTIDKVEFYGRSGQPQTKWCDNQIRTMYHVNYYRWPFLPKIRRMAMKMRG
ncbi:MAG: GNAT family N-acetyltransferase [Burkholderiales bacterium]